jgi:hypothetical protein
MTQWLTSGRDGAVDQLQSTSIPPSSSGTVSCLCLEALGLNENASQTSC